MTRVAAIDLGSNSTRLLVADMDAGGALQDVASRSVVTRLGEGVDRSSTLSGAAMDRVLGVVGEYRAVMDDLGAERRVGVLTSAGRDARNGEAFARVITDRHGIPTRVLTGDEEARLVFAGATSDVRGPGTVLVLDVGGGSTEIATGSGCVLKSHQSLQLGVVRHSERFLHGDPPTSEEIAGLRRDAAAQLQTASRVLAGGTTLAVGGTPVTCQAILGSQIITRADCEELLLDLASMPLAERQAVPGLHPDRAPAIIAGLAIHLELLSAIGAPSFTVCERDLRHGAALNLTAAV